ncbi:MAG: xylulokinase [Anaerovoracaceae bacterium]|jgi:xylulokinase
MAVFVVAYDIGTTGVKSCLFSISEEEKIKYVNGHLTDYNLTLLDNGGAEQDPDEWWDAICTSTKAMLEESGVDPCDVKGVSFCAQCQCLILVDRDGKVLRPSMNYLDARAKKQYEEGVAFGVKIAGMNARRLLKWIRIGKTAAGSVKDPPWKYNWVKENEPDIMAKTYKYMDAKDYLAMRMTGNYTATPDSAYAAFLYDMRPGKNCWSRELCDMVGVDYSQLSPLIKATDVVGSLLEDRAEEMGLLPGTPVFSGGNDVSLTGVGCGAVLPGDTHIYTGTSGWVSTVVDKPLLDINCMIGAIPGVDPETYNYYAELETAGKCLEWARDHLGLDDLEVFSDHRFAYEDSEAAQKNIYSYIIDKIKDVPAGSNGVIFTPWLQGNRCPFEDVDSRGMFFNLGLETNAKELIHAVLEGISMHYRWMIEEQSRKTPTSDPVRFVGGGALSPLTCQILADVLGRTVETISDPQNVGAMGAAAVMAVGLGFVDDIKDIKGLIPVKAAYRPNSENTAVYDKIMPVFKELHKQNEKAFHALNGK